MKKFFDGALLVLLLGGMGYFALWTGSQAGAIFVQRYMAPAPMAHITMPAYAVARTVVIWSREGEGAGVRISSHGHILTVAHLFGVSERWATVQLKDGDMIPAEILFVDERADLALLKTYEDGTPYAVLAATEPHVGAHLWAVGAPLGFPFSVNDGRVSAYQTIDKRRLMQVSITVNPGNSGGPVLNDAGELVGIADLVYFSSSNAAVTPVGFADDEGSLRRFLDRFVGLPQ